MMQSMIWAATTLAITMTIAVTTLRAWRGWLDLRRYELDADRRAGTDDAGVRIELAGLRERMRKLEAIATGVDP